MDENDTGAWRDEIAGEDSDRMETLKGFESPDEFHNAYFDLKNKNWRDDYSGGDDKFKSTLERFSTPEDMGKSYREAQQTIRSGNARKMPDADASEADIKAYREANNIPLEATGYLENLPDGLVIGEDDKELMQDFMGTLHTKNVSPDVAHEVIKWYNNFAESQQEQLAESDRADQTDTEDKLRQDWGGDYRQNINLVGALIEKTFGTEGKDILLNARDANGRAIMNTPEIMFGLSELARSINPVAAVVGPSQDAQQTLNDEIAGIEKVMRENRSAYNKDQKMQDRLLELYDIRIKHGKVA